MIEAECRAVEIPEKLPEANLRAYLACALTGLSEVERERVYALCKELQAVCGEYGVSLYLPFEHTDPISHPDVPAPEVYLRDRRKVITSDLVLMLCVAASYGVGQENEIAANHGIPVLYLVQIGSVVSRMLLGSDTRKQILEYTDHAELISNLRSFLSETVPALRQRRESLGRAEPLNIGQRIRDLRERSSIPTKTLADLIGIDEQTLVRIETNPDDEAGLTVSHLRTVCVFLGVDVPYLVVGATAIKDERMRRSQDNLKIVARDEDMSYQDFELLWEAYLRDQRQKIGYAAAAKSTQIVGKEQWRGRYKKLITGRGNLELEF